LIVQERLSSLNKSLQTNHRLVRQFLKFAVVGTIGAGVDFGILTALVELFYLNLYVANTVSFTAAVLSNYLWNSFWTFGDLPKQHGRQLVQFFAVSLIGLFINQAILYFFYDIAGLHVFRFGYLAAKALATIVVLFWNFAANKLWTFRER
jgi:putative flippase GtrA